MKYLNVSLLGLAGRLHPAITGVSSTHEVRKMRQHIKMLSGNYLTFEVKSRQSGGSDKCRLCFDDVTGICEVESLEHLIAICVKLEDVRNRIKTTITNIFQETEISINLKELSSNDFTQFILDPSSMSLSQRVNINEPMLPKLFSISRGYCYVIEKTRLANLALLS